MTLEEWIVLAMSDARARGLEALVPALEGLAAATAVLRAADWNDDASGQTSGQASGHASERADAASAAMPPTSPQHDA